MSYQYKKCLIISSWVNRTFTAYIKGGKPIECKTMKEAMLMIDLFNKGK